MAPHLLLLFLLVCTAERDGLSVAAGPSGEESDLLVNSSSRQRVLSGNFSVSFRDLENPLQNMGDGARTLPSKAFSLNDRKPSHFDFEDDTAGHVGTLKTPKSAAKSTISKRSLELTVNQENRGNLTNGGVKDVINAFSPVSGSEEEYAAQPGLRLETAVPGVLPVRTGDRSKWVTRSEDGRPPAEPRARRRRSWLWNQFFVIEEYRGPEPVLIGRVSFCHGRVLFM